MNKSLSKRTLDSFPPGTKDYFVWDTSKNGLGVKVCPTGAKVFVLQYRIGGRSRRYTIGPYGRYTPDMAHKEAATLLGRIAKGQDPAEQKTRDRQQLTVKGLGEQYLAEHARPHKKPSSREEDERQLRKYIYPALGSRRLDHIRRGHIAKLHHSPPKEG